MILAVLSFECKNLRSISPDLLSNAYFAIPTNASRVSFHLFFLAIYIMSFYSTNVPDELGICAQNWNCQRRTKHGKIQVAHYSMSIEVLKRTYCRYSIIVLGRFLSNCGLYPGFTVPSSGLGGSMSR